MLTSEIPFWTDGDQAAWRSRRSRGPNWSFARKVSEEGKHSCRELLIVDSSTRPTAEKCLKHPRLRNTVTPQSAGDVKDVHRGVCFWREWTDVQKFDPAKVTREVVCLR